MRKIINYISAFMLIFMISSCWQSSVPTPERPSDIPANVPPVWEHWHQEAYDEGRIGFNDDSTVMVILSPRPSKFPEVNDFELTKEMFNGEKDN